MATIKLKRLHPGAKLPKLATPGSAAFDLYLPQEARIPHGRIVIPLGWAIELPAGYRMEVKPRSGFSSKGMDGKMVSPEGLAGLIQTKFDADVLYGLIDPDYRGEIGVIIKNYDRPFTLKAGTRIAQAVISEIPEIEFEETDELTATQRGTEGFGHTGI